MKKWLEDLKYLIPFLFLFVGQFVPYMGFLSFFMFIPILFYIFKEPKINDQYKKIIIFSFFFSFTVNFWTIHYLVRVKENILLSFLTTMIAYSAIMLPLALSLISTSFLIKKTKKNIDILFFPLIYFIIRLFYPDFIPFTWAGGLNLQVDIFNSIFISRYIGLEGMVFLVIFINTFLFYLLKLKKIKTLIFSSIIILFSIEMLGLMSKPKEKEGKEIDLTLIQTIYYPNDITFDEYIQKLKFLIESAKKQYPNSDAFIFSENSFIFDMKNMDNPIVPEVRQIYDSIKDLPVFIAGGSWEHKGKELNVIAEFNKGNPQNIYSKKKLMPFGETAYFSFLEPIVGKYNYTNKSPFNDYVLKSDKFTYSPIICFEALFPLDLRKTSLTGEILMVLANNDYGRNKLLNIRFLSQSLSLGIELGKPVVSFEKAGHTMALDGNSKFVVDNNGKKIFSEINSPDILNFKIKVPPYEKTFYAKHGRLSTYGLIFIIYTTLIGTLCFIKNDD